MGEAHCQPKLALARRDNLVEQRQHPQHDPFVVYIDECGAAVQWTHGLDSKIASPSVVRGYLVSRHYQCA